MELASDLDLFGEPARTAGLSQFFTPMWVARRAARWIPPTIDGMPTRVLEPSAGCGNLVAGWLWSAGAERESQVTTCEVDPRWYDVLRRTFPKAHHYCGSFLEWTPLMRVDDGTRRLWAFPSQIGRWDYAIQNPPYEEGADAAHVVKALEHCERVVAVVKSDFEFSAARDRVVWSRARPVRRALLVDRPDFGETMEKDSEGPARRSEEHTSELQSPI